MDTTSLVSLTSGKLSLLMALGAGTVLATEIGEPSIERYVSLGVGGVLATTIFYFYKQLAAQSAKREKETSDEYKLQAALMIVTLQDATKVNTVLSAAVTELRTTVNELNRDQRERYEQELRDAGGRRAYDPGPHKDD